MTCNWFLCLEQNVASDLVDSLDDYNVVVKC